MNGHFVVFAIMCICLPSSHAEVLTSAHNVLCNPLPKVVPVEGNGEPYFVVVQQCQGSIPKFHPDTKTCVAATSTDVLVKVTSPTGVEDKILKNHTSCKEECVQRCPSDLFTREKNCNCKCNLQEAPAGRECDATHEWDSENCNCKCKLTNPPKGKVVDPLQCKFVCKPRNCRGRTLHPDTCRCVKPNVGALGNGSDNDSSQGKFLAAIVIGEFVLLYLIFDFLLYSKKTGLMYYVRCKCRGKPTELNQNETGQCLHTENNSNNVPMGVVVDRNGCSHVTPETTMHVSST